MACINSAQKEQTMSFKEITPEQAWEMVQNGAMLADVRDPQRFTYSHAKGAFHLTNQSFLQFEELVDFDSPIIVSCYHGVSSRNVATFLVEQGYENVFSIITWEVLAITGCAVLLFGICITAICAYVSVNSFLRMKAGELYKI